jgi:hypothetical protein
MSQDKDEASKTPIEIAAEVLKEALAPHFKGKLAEDRLGVAVADAVSAIAHLIVVKDNVRKRPLGATVMTEQASGQIRPGIAPRSL